MARSRKHRLNLSRKVEYSSSDSARERRTVRIENVRNVLQKLATPAVNERHASAAAIMTMAEDPESRSLLIQHDMWAQLLQGLSDSDEFVLLSTSTALRALVADEHEGDKCCHKLQALNTGFVLDSALQKIADRSYESLTGLEDSNSKGLETYLFPYIENIIFITTRMHECSALHDEGDSTRKFLNACTKLVSIRSRCPARRISTLCQCLESYMEDEVALAALSVHHDMLIHLRALTKESDSCCAVLAAGLLQRVVYLRAEATQVISNDMAELLTLVVDTLRTALLDISTAYTTEWYSIATEQQEVLETAVESTLETLSRLALPIMTKKGTHDTGDSSLTFTTQSMLHTLVVQLLQPVLPFALPLPRIQENGAGVLDQSMQIIHLLAMDYLHNLAWSMVISDATELQAAWTQLSPGLWEWALTNLSTFLIQDEEMADSSLSLIYGLAKFTGTILTMSHTQVNDFIKLYHSSLNAEVQTKIVGLLGCIALQQGSIAINKSIGTFLVTVVASLPRSDPEVVIEALDAMFDIYADMAFDYDEPVFVQGNFPEHLRKALPKVRQMTKAIERRQSRELRQRAEEVIINLAAFIDYKRSERL